LDALTSGPSIGGSNMGSKSWRLQLWCPNLESSILDAPVETWATN